MDSHWETILANGVYFLLLAVAYAIREWATSKWRSRVENKIDGNTALTATGLVSSGNLPESAPCPAAVAKAVSKNNGDPVTASEYAKTATDTAQATMKRENIPVQNQALLVNKLHDMLVCTARTAEETRVKEERHSENNAAWVKTLREEMDRLKAEMQSMKSEGHSDETIKQS